MELDQTIYSYYGFELISGNFNTTALLKMVSRSGEITDLDKVINPPNLAEFKKLPKQQSIIRSYELTVDRRYNRPFKIKFELPPTFLHTEGSFNGRDEQAIITIEKKSLNIFVCKHPNSIWGCFSHPDYRHDYFPYTTTIKKLDYASVPTRDWAYQKFLRNDEGILNDMDRLLKSSTLL